MSNRLCEIYVQIVNGVKKRATQQQICEQSLAHPTANYTSIIVTQK
jgi:hypothetical protein